MSEPGASEQEGNVAIKERRVLESVGATGSVAVQETEQGDFLVVKTGRLPMDPGPFGEVLMSKNLVTAMTQTLPALNELYPQTPQSSNDPDTEQFTLAGKERIDAFRKKYLIPFGANTAPVVFLERDEFTKELITQQIAAGNLTIALGKTSTEYPVHDLSFHLLGLLAVPQETFTVLKAVAQKVPELEKENPVAAHKLRKAIAIAWDSATNISVENGGELWVPSLDILNRLVYSVENEANYNTPGREAHDLVDNVLRNHGFEIVESPNRLSNSRQTLQNGRSLYLVNHLSQRLTSEPVVPREQELLVAYVPKLVGRLQKAA
jgi:hypothetical protein